jgi:hypothetical protein
MGWFERELNWGVPPPELRHLCGRIGELYVAMITNGQMATLPRGRGFPYAAESGFRPFRAEVGRREAFPGLAPWALESRPWGLTEVGNWDPLKIMSPTSAPSPPAPLPRGARGDMLASAWRRCLASCQVTLRRARLAGAALPRPLSCEGVRCWRAIGGGALGAAK